MKKLFPFLIIAATLTSAQTTWSVDRSHSYVSFSVPYMMLSDVTGKFSQFDAQVESTQDDFSDAAITVTIQAKSIDTGNEMRDKHLRSTDFFNTDTDSIVRFKSMKIEKVSGNTYKISGALTMRGTTKEVMLDAVYKGKAKGYKGVVAGFNASTTINRKDWGLNWNRAIEAGGVLVGDKVTINIAVQLIQNETTI